jgi:hypothetical protein
MQPSFPAHALLAAAVLFIAGPAHALSTESGTLGFSIALRDLNPADGIAPSLTLDPRSRSVVFAGQASPTASASWTQQGDSAFGVVSASGEVDGTGGAASFTGGSDAGTEMAASAFGGPSLDVGSSMAYVSTPSFGQGNFVLGPRTEVTLVAWVTIDWSASNPGATTSGEADLSLWRFVGDSQELIEQRYVTGGYYGDGVGDLSGSTSGAMGIVFDNDSDASVLMGLDLALSSNASELETVPSPVDEPAAAALLLAGMSTLLWRARRRIS